MTAEEPQKKERQSFAKAGAKNENRWLAFSLVLPWLFPQMLSCAPFDGKAETAFRSLSYNDLATDEFNISSDSQDKHERMEGWLGPAQSIRIRFTTSNIATRWNVYVEAFSRRKGLWCHETYWLNGRTNTISDYTIYPMKLTDAAFAKKYGKDQHRI